MIAERCRLRQMGIPEYLGTERGHLYPSHRSEAPRPRSSKFHSLLVEPPAEDVPLVPRTCVHFRSRPDDWGPIAIQGLSSDLQHNSLAFRPGPELTHHVPDRTRNQREASAEGRGSPYR